MKAKDRGITSRDKGERQEAYEAVPDVNKLNTEFEWCLQHRDQSYWSRQRQNYETRRCLWPYKSTDGRKWSAPKGQDVFPWMGASDVEVPLVDKYLREDVALLMGVWRGNRILVRPTKPSRDAGWATRMTAFLRWLVYEHIEDAEDEAELAANLYLERGAVVISTIWDRVETLVYQTLSMEQLVQASQVAMARLRRGEQDPALLMQAELPQRIQDPAQEEQVVELVLAFLAQAESIELDRVQTRKLIRQLRETGEAKFPRSDVLYDRPQFVALGLNDDVVFPPEVVDPQRARNIFRREMLTETEVSERIRTAGWDPNWVDQVIENQRGRVTSQFGQRTGQRKKVGTGGEWDTTRLFEVIHAHERRYDENGVPGIWYTCFSAGVSEYVAAHDLLNYEHGQYPYTVMALEKRSRSLDDSRGYGERAHTWQRQIKVEWDQRIDRASIATLPPSFHPPGEAPEQWGPGVQIETRRPERYGFMQVPKLDAGSRDAEESVRRFADEYFGRPVDEQNKVEATMLKQELVRGWLKGWKRVNKQALQLCQQFMPDDFYFRVVGGEQGRLIHATREEIQGQFNVVMSFNVRDMDPEYVAEKTALLEKAMMFDRNGRIDSDEALNVIFELVDPGYGERLLRPGEAASMNEIEDEKRVLSQILQGIPVDVKPGMAYGLRLQTLKSLVMQSPTVQAKVKANPQVQQMLQTRAAQLQHQLDQRQNAQTGKFLGTKPMMEEMTNQ